MFYCGNLVQCEIIVWFGLSKNNTNVRIHDCAIHVDGNHIYGLINCIVFLKRAKTIIIIIITMDHFNISFKIFIFIH